MSDAVWFENKNAGVFFRDDGQVKRWMNELLSELASIKKKSQYREEDFRKHRQVVGDDCWVTDIMEGDYSLTRSAIGMLRNATAGLLQNILRIPGDI